MEFNDTMNFKGLMEKFSNFELDGNGIKIQCHGFKDSGDGRFNDSTTVSELNSTMTSLEESRWTRRNSLSSAITGVSSKSLALGEGLENFY